jgi:hypothetical protein
MPVSFGYTDVNIAAYLPKARIMKPAEAAVSMGWFCKNGSGSAEDMVTPTETNVRIE